MTVVIVTLVTMLVMVATGGDDDCGGGALVPAIRAMLGAVVKLALALALVLAMKRTATRPCRRSPLGHRTWWSWT